MVTAISIPFVYTFWSLLTRFPVKNGRADILYVLGGFLLMQTWGMDNPLWRGHGIGIMVQGGFLLFFDLFHALALQNMNNLKSH